MSEAPALAVEGLRVDTDGGLPIVADVSFSVATGDVLALVGESGSGKTTTALALLGHARPGLRIVGGRALLDGDDVLAASPRRLARLRGSAISYVPQDPTSGLNPRHRVGSQVAEALTVHGSSSTDARRVTRELSERVGLPADETFLHRYPFELSGGQQQRVAIAMALACRPRVVVLDEPTTGLDVTTQARVLELLRELASERAVAFVYVTHDLAVVDSLASRVAVMYAGRIVEEGACARVMADPAHPYTALLLGSVPRMSARTRLAGIPGRAPAAGNWPPGCSFAPRCPIAIEQCTVATPPPVAVADGHAARCLRVSQLAVPDLGEPDAHVERSGDPPLLEIDGLAASYGSLRVLHGVSLAVPRGGCLALVGESGSGKTTLGRCVVGLHAPDSGTIRLGGEALALAARTRTRGQRRAVQIVFQNPDRSLNPSRTVGDQIARPLALFGLAPGGSDARVVELLERVRLPADRAARYPRELSGGEKQRAAIARALAAEPQLLVCDEVTSALDVSIQAAVIDLLAELRAGGLALLFITHNLALVSSVADSVLVLQDGVVREHGSTRAVIGSPADPYTRALVAAVPELREPLRR